MELKAMIETTTDKLDEGRLMVEELEDGLLVVSLDESNLVAAVFGKTDPKSPTLTRSAD